MSKVNENQKIGFVYSFNEGLKTIDSNHLLSLIVLASKVKVLLLYLMIDWYYKYSIGCEQVNLIHKTLLRNLLITCHM